MKNKLEPIFQSIVELIKTSEPPFFAVFDFDNTCIFNDIGDATLAYLVRMNAEKYKSFFDENKKLTDEGRLREAYEVTVKSLCGLSVKEAEELCKKVLAYEAESIKPRKEIIELINCLKKGGLDVWVISASAEVLVRQTMKHFGVEANLIAVKNIIAGGKITSGIENLVPMFEGKVECIKKFIDPKNKPLLGVGDSINDLSMLEYCKIKVVVDRQNALAKTAKQNNWFLI